MRFTQVAAPLALAGLVSAAPATLSRRANIDGVVLNFALTLEHLEATFYREGLNMYNAGAFEGEDLPEWVRYRITEIASEEATHVTFLTTALTAAGVTPVQECTYDFGLTTPASFIALAQVLEGVGVSAYLGAAPLITSKAYLGVAGSILIVEAEHDTWIRSAASNQDGFPRPFAPPLNPMQAYTLAAPFFVSCPKSSPALPFTAFPSITVNTKGPYKTGQKISITAPKGLKGPVYAAFVDAINTTYQEISATGGTVTIPAGITGQSYLILTSSKAATDAATLAGPAILEIPVAATNFPY